MYIDAANRFSDAQSLAGVAAGTALSEKSIYVGTAATVPGMTSATPVNDPGRGGEKEILCQVVEDFDSAGDDTTLFVELVQADDEGLTTNLAVLNRTPIIAQATMVKGYNFRMGTVPPGVSQAYLGLRFNVGTSTPTAGKITAGLVESLREASLSAM
jgi:hypothetical protein